MVMLRQACSEKDVDLVSQTKGINRQSTKCLSRQSPSRGEENERSTGIEKQRSVGFPFIFLNPVILDFVLYFLLSQPISLFELSDNCCKDLPADRGEGTWHRVSFLFLHFC